MRTAIRDIAEGAEMGLETGSVQLLSSVCSKVVFSEKLEQCATDEQREKGLDIADFLLMADTPMMTLQKMIKRCPSLQTLIDQFQLESVEQ